MDVTTIIVERLYTYTEEKDNYEGPKLSRVDEMAEFSSSDEVLRVGNHKNCEFFLKKLNTVIEFHRKENSFVVFASHPDILLQFGANDNDIFSRGPVNGVEFPLGSHVRFGDMRISAEINYIDDDIATSEQLVIKDKITKSGGTIAWALFCIATGILLFFLSATDSYKWLFLFNAGLFCFLLAIIPIVALYWRFEIDRNFQIKRSKMGGIFNQHYDLRDNAPQCLIGDLPGEDIYSNMTTNPTHRDGSIPRALMILTGAELIHVRDLSQRVPRHQQCVATISYFTRMPILYLKYRRGAIFDGSKKKLVEKCLSHVSDRIRVSDAR